jgi:hypothetical protein
MSLTSERRQQLLDRAWWWLLGTKAATAID